jgi:hypothetical protein
MRPKLINLNNEYQRVTNFSETYFELNPIGLDLVSFNLNLNAFI